MRLILALLIVVIPSLAVAAMRRQEQSVDDAPSELGDQSFLEGVGIMVSKLTRGERNNNPGNIRLSGVSWLGQVTGSDSAFATFGAPEDGIRALAKLLQTYQSKYNLGTVQEIIRRYAPASENNTDSYIRAVSADVGVYPTQRVDLFDSSTLERVVTAIIKHENGRVIYSRDTISAAIKRALS